MPPLDYRSLAKIRGLAPHAQRHARQLLQLHPLLQVTSGYRSVAHNRRVGGSVTSFHVRRRAVDIIGPLHDLQVAAQEAWGLRIGPDCTGPEEVLLEDSGEPGQHLHVAW